MSYVGLPTCLYRNLDIWFSTIDLVLWTITQTLLR